MKKAKLKEFTQISDREVNVAQIPLLNLKFGNYQKRLNENRVQAIVNEFDRNRMRPIEVSYRDGFYWVFDGQHRVAAYQKMDIKTIPCQIHEGLTYEDEAMLFAKQQENVGRVTAVHKWNAFVEAKTFSALKTIDIANEFGYSILVNGDKANKILAVGTIMDIVTELGFNGLRDILMITRNCWNNQEYAVTGDVLNALKIFINLYGQCDEFNINKLIEKLKKVKCETLFNEALTNKFTKTKAMSIAKIIYHTYNSGIRKENKLPYKFDF